MHPLCGLGVGCSARLVCVHMMFALVQHNSPKTMFPGGFVDAHRPSLASRPHPHAPHTLCHSNGMGSDAWVVGWGGVPLGSRGPCLCGSGWAGCFRE